MFGKYVNKENGTIIYTIPNKVNPIFVNGFDDLPYNCVRNINVISGNTINKYFASKSFVAINALQINTYNLVMIPENFET